MNEKEHWNKIADKYNDEIFDVYHSDKFKILPKYFKKHANETHAAIDFGCGNGKSLPYLSPLFKNVVGIDISQNLINQAKKRNFKNVKFQTLDLSKPNLKLPKVNFVFCCNVIMLPVIEKNYSMLKNIYNALLPGGKAMIVLPALESALFSTWQLIDMYRREGVEPKKIPMNDLGYFGSSKIELAQGIMHIDNVPTKHYSKLELNEVFKNAGLKITKLKKVEYDWDTELSEPPKTIAEPYPWDWLVICERG